MASAAKHRQASLRSFLRPCPIIASAPEPRPDESDSDSEMDDCGVAAPVYERLREENIRRNQEFFEKLGVHRLLPPPAATPPPTKRKLTKALPDSSATLRRSTRKRPERPLLPPPDPPRRSIRSRAAEAPGPVPLRRSGRKHALLYPSSLVESSDTDEDEEESDTDGDEEESKIDGDMEEEEKPGATYVESVVFQYTCYAPKDPTFGTSPHSPALESSLSGFRVTGKTLRDPSLAKIYTVDVCPVKGSRVLVAAGGHGGIVSIFGSEWGEDNDNDDGDVEETQGPLMSWKASSSWVSSVRFMKENKNLLVSTSNDGTVVVWDITKQSPSFLSSSSSTPPIVAESKGLHSGGIFSMDILGCTLVTASKDSSLGVSTIAAAGELVVENKITGHHTGGIRGVCFGDTKDALADCGADGCICILDTRLAEPCTLTIETNHSSGVNTVEWCPSNKFLLMSASKDPTLLLYDIRNPSVPVSELQGHTEPISRTCSQIYRPTFVGSGTSIATPGSGSRKISIYTVDTGKLLSQGLIGYDPNLVVFAREVADDPRLWTAGRQINQLCPDKLNQSSGIFDHPAEGK